MSSSVVEYTIYVPGTPLQQQLVARSQPVLTEIDLLGIPYRIGSVAFKTLKVNETYLDIVLHLKTAINSSKENDVELYDQFTFTVKSIHSKDIDLEDVSSDEIEGKIKAIFETRIQ